MINFFSSNLGAIVNAQTALSRITVTFQKNGGKSSKISKFCKTDMSNNYLKLNFFNTEIIP